MKRTYVVVDDKLFGRAKRLTGLRTTRNLLDRALRQLVAREEQRRLLRPHLAPTKVTCRRDAPLRVSSGFLRSY